MSAFLYSKEPKEVLFPLRKQAGILVELLAFTSFTESGTCWYFISGKSKVQYRYRTGQVNSAVINL